MSNPMFKMIGYEEKTTFWDDFSIADAFGMVAIKDTYRRAFNEWKSKKCLNMVNCITICGKKQTHTHLTILKALN